MLKRGVEMREKHRRQRKSVQHQTNTCINLSPLACQSGVYYNMPAMDTNINAGHTRITRSLIQ